MANLKLDTIQARLVTRLLIKPITTDVLAQAVGLTPTQVSASLLPLKGEGLLQTNRQPGAGYVTWYVTQKLIDILYSAKDFEPEEPEVDPIRGYILWCPTSDKAPKVVHPTLAKAQEVQRIMAVRNSGQVFHICAVFGGLKQEVQTRLVEV